MLRIQKAAGGISDFGELPIRSSSDFVIFSLITDLLAKVVATVSV